MKAGLLSVLCVAGSLWLPGNILSAADWTVDSVDAVGTQVKYTSMKIDTLGNVHVAYVVDDSNREPLRYAFWDHALKRWFVMTVDLNVGTCSLTLDSQQLPRIAYTDFAGGRLRYAQWDGTRWKTEALPLNAQNINYYQSIALSSDDRPNIAFYEYEGPKGTDFKIRLRSVMWDGSRWGLRTVDSDQGSGKFNAMVADPQGNLHLVYANVSAATGGIRYAYWNGQAWKTEILEGEKENNGHGVGWSCNIALDKNGIPQITYMDEVEGLVKYAVRRNGRWQIQVIGRVRGVGYPDRNSIALDDHGVPYIGYFDAGRGSLQVTHPDGQKWIVETLDTENAGFTSSMQINDGMIWISYGDLANGGLKVAHRSLSGAPTVGAPSAVMPGDSKK
jgi:hypothetical protein